MANVVHLNDYRREDRRSEPPQGGATIHLFLGVRYERHEIAEDRPQPPVTPGRRKARKRA